MARPEPDRMASLRPEYANRTPDHARADYADVHDDPHQGGCQTSRYWTAIQTPLRVDFQGAPIKPDLARTSCGDRRNGSSSPRPYRPKRVGTNVRPLLDF